MLTIETHEGTQIDWADDKEVKLFLSFYKPTDIIMIFDESGKLLDCLEIRDLF